jgi:dTDP-4-dehydrorhamnose 3,5-epimerase
VNVIETSLPGVLIFEPKVFGDERGFFTETFRESVFQQHCPDVRFVQDNQSRSRKGVLRGLHYQYHNPQGKLVRVSRGVVFDVAVDIRAGSPHYGQWTGVVLDDVSHRQLWIPPGFAHGFCVISDEADFVYKCTSYYDAASDSGIAWNDPDVGIAWPELGVDFSLSPKDLVLPRLKDLARERMTFYR